MLGFKAIVQELQSASQVVAEKLHRKTKQHTKMLVNPHFCGLIPQFCGFSIKTTPTSHVKDQPAVLASLGRGCSHCRKGLGNGASATWDMVNFTTLGG